MENTLYQVAALQSLLMGNYYASVPYRELLTLADTGIGAFEGMNGEMIALDGTVYQAAADGSVSKAPEDAAAPYCCMAKFVPERSAKISACPDYEALCAALDAMIPASERNLFHMVKLTGAFDSVDMRSVVGKTPPYEITGDFVMAEQLRFRAENVSGTAVALHCPDYMDRLNMPGWHLHFITADRTLGGHVFQMSVKNASAELCTLSRFEMLLPRSEVFNGLELTSIGSDAVGQMEKE